MRLGAGFGHLFKRPPQDLANCHFFINRCLRIQFFSLGIQREVLDEYSVIFRKPAEGLAQSRLQPFILRALRSYRGINDVGHILQ